ncbi:MAG: AEC family transporter [Bacteroidales bacterium]|nr:AEC family transporter [Bacteroidales bacterium]
MENFLFSINTVAPLFILISAGYIARQINFISDQFLSEANKFVFKLLLPLMLFENIRVTFHGEFTNIRLIFSALIGVALVIAISSFVVPLFVKRNGQRGSMIQGIYRSNFLIYGMPLATGMYGQSAAQSISMSMGIMIPFYNVAAVIILTFFSENRKKSISAIGLLKGIFTNPLILGCLAGLLFGLLPVTIPTAIEKPISGLAGAASPLALFLMGGEFKFRRLSNNLYKVIWVTVARLIIVPSVAMAAFIMMGFREVDLSVLLCIFATPTAVSSYIMANNMGCDGELSAQIVVLTTVSSSLTIFFFIFALRGMGVL